MLEWILTIIVAWLVADFLSGLWHWIEDRYFDTQWPLIGEYIAKPNELHHAQPAAFLNQGYWRRNWTTIVPASTALAIALPMRAPWWLCLAFVFVSQANEIHAWAHRRVTRRVIRGLQEFGVLQSVRHHMLHHKDPFSTRYCVMSDWLNPVLDRLLFWRGCEWLLARVGIPIRPDCKEADQRHRKESTS